MVAECSYVMVVGDPNFVVVVLKSSSVSNLRNGFFFFKHTNKTQFIIFIYTMSKIGYSDSVKEPQSCETLHYVQNLIFRQC